MSQKFKKFIETVQPTLNEDAIDKLFQIENKDGHETLKWREAAVLFKSLPAKELASFLQYISDGTFFTPEEKTEVRKSLARQGKEIDKFIASEKVTDEDRKNAAEWKKNCSSAYEKLNIPGEAEA